MSESNPFEIDFSEAKLILDLPQSTQAVEAGEASRLSKIWGFSTQQRSNKSSGHCALGTLLNFHGIGWHHLPKQKNGRPINDPFIAEIAIWSEAPDLLDESMGTSPDLILKSLRKAGLIAHWYAGNTASKTMELIQYEIEQCRPVIVLTNNKHNGDSLLLEWQVVFQLDDTHVHTKHSGTENGTRAAPIDRFKEIIEMDYAPLSCSVITALKE